MAKQRETPGQIMRAAREKNGKTQAEVATECGVTQAAIAQYESDERLPPTRAVRTVARAYGVRPEQLLPESAA